MKVNVKSPVSLSVQVWIEVPLHVTEYTGLLLVPNLQSHDIVIEDIVTKEI